MKSALVMCAVQAELERLSLNEELEYLDETGEYSYVVSIQKEDLKLKISIPEEYPDIVPSLELIPLEKKEVDEKMQRILLNLAEDCCKSAVGKPIVEILMNNWKTFIKSARGKPSINPTSLEPVKNKKAQKRERQEKNKKAKLAARFSQPVKPSAAKMKTPGKNLDKNQKASIETTKESKSMIIEKFNDAKSEVQKEHEKKPSMKTAKDVINRISWDDSLDAHEFVVGYLDRFDGIIETPFLGLNWKDDIASTGPKDLLVLPEHRIEYFKWKTEIVWDKSKRMDSVFGSSGSSLDIHKFIDGYMEKQRRTAAVVPAASSVYESLQSDAGENIPPSQSVSGSLSSNLAPPAGEKPDGDGDCDEMGEVAAGMENVQISSPSSLPEVMDTGSKTVSASTPPGREENAQIVNDGGSDKDQNVTFSDALRTDQAPAAGEKSDSDLAGDVVANVGNADISSPGSLAEETDIASKNVSLLTTSGHEEYVQIENDAYSGQEQEAQLDENEEKKSGGKQVDKSREKRQRDGRHGGRYMEKQSKTAAEVPAARAVDESLQRDAGENIPLSQSVSGPLGSDPAPPLGDNDKMGEVIAGVENIQISSSSSLPEVTDTGSKTVSASTPPGRDENAQIVNDAASDKNENVAFADASCSDPAPAAGEKSDSDQAGEMVANVGNTDISSPGSLAEETDTASKSVSLLNTSGHEEDVQIENDAYSDQEQDEQLDENEQRSGGKQAGKSKRQRDGRHGGASSSSSSGGWDGLTHGGRKPYDKSDARSHKHSRKSRWEPQDKDYATAHRKATHCVAMDLDNPLLTDLSVLQKRLLHMNPGAERHELFITAITCSMDIRDVHRVGKELYRISQSWDAFELTLNGLSHEDNYIVATISESSDLRGLCSRLQRNLRHEFQFTYCPHVKLVGNIQQSNGSLGLHQQQVSGSQMVASAVMATIVGEICGQYCHFQQGVVKDMRWQVQVSKTLSAVLRHNAMGLKVNEEGFIDVNKLLRNNYFSQKMKVEEEDIVNIVQTNSKQRFFIEGKKGHMRIRANQGHSVQVQSLCLQEITDPAKYPNVVHGTIMKYWNPIRKEGLDRMKRNHIHMTTAEPNSHEQVISGMRSTSNCFIYVDIAKAMADGIKFVLSGNGVILSEGIDGVIAPKYFKRVWGKRNGNRCLLMQDGILKYKDADDVPRWKEEGMKEITDPGKYETVVHEMNVKFWKNTQKSGLMNVKKHGIYMSLERGGEEQRKRKTKENKCLIYIDVAKAMEDGVKFFASDRGEIWSEGVEGVIDAKYFKEAYVVSNGNRESLLTGSSDGKTERKDNIAEKSSSSAN